MCALSGGLYEHLGADVPVGATWGLTAVGPPDALVGKASGARDVCSLVSDVI